MTEKLFYQDSYIAEFEAKVLTCIHKGERYEAVLDRTAFFPEGGGQSADTGMIYAENGSVQVNDVHERDGVVVHYVSGPLPEGETVTGKLDFRERFSKMQQHTGEHIISGIVNRDFGYRNVGFHLGNEIVTMDYDGPLTPKELRLIEYEANEAVAADIPVEVMYPSKEELETIFYRSKIEIEGQVRIVRIPGYDSCACCAPHVKTTGSIGIVKIVNAINYKGGMRLTMMCGFRALEDYRQKEDSVIKISNMLSTKQEEVSDAVCHLREEIAQQKEKIKKLQERYVAGCLEEEKKKLEQNPNGNLLLFLEELDSISMRNFVNEAMKLTPGICGVFVGNEDQGFRYVLGTDELDIRTVGKKMNQEFQGKGGGKPPMIQGSLTGSEKEIRRFLEQY